MMRTLPLATPATGTPAEVMRATTRFYEVLFEAADKRVALRLMRTPSVQGTSLRREGSVPVEYHNPLA